MNKETITTIILITLIITIAIAIIYDVSQQINDYEVDVYGYGCLPNGDIHTDKLMTLGINSMWYLLEVIALILVINGGFYFNIKLYQQKLKKGEIQ